MDLHLSFQVLRLILAIVAAFLRLNLLADDDKPVRLRYRCTPLLRYRCTPWLISMLDKQVIQESFSHDVLPIVLIRKKDDDLKMCMN